MRGVTTHVSDPKISTACTTALKKKLKTRGADPYLLRTRDIFLQIFLARENFFTVADQSSFAAHITRPRYLKEVTIPRGSP